MQTTHQLGSRFRLKDLGEIKQCLGINKDKEKGCIMLCQENYVNQLLKKFKMTDKYGSTKKLTYQQV